MKFFLFHYFCLSKGALFCVFESPKLDRDCYHEYHVEESVFRGNKETFLSVPSSFWLDLPLVISKSSIVVIIIIIRKTLRTNKEFFFSPKNGTPLPSPLWDCIVPKKKNIFFAF